MPETLSTHALRPNERFDFWRDVICDVFLPLEAEPRGTPVDQFAGAVSVARLDELHIVRVDSAGQHVVRQPTDACDDVLISIQLHGRGVVSQDGHAAVLSPGCLALYDATRPYELTFEHVFSQLVVQLPRPTLRQRGVDVDSSVAHAVPGHGLAAITTSMLSSLLRDGESVAADVQRQLAGQALDLLALTLAPADRGEGSARRRIEERQRVLAHVLGRLSDPALGVADVARRLGVSTRYLQKLFADTGHTLSARIRDARLQRARELLILRPHLTVTDVAHGTGFSDAAHFSRSFRARYGTTPSAARRAGV